MVGLGFHGKLHHLLELVSDLMEQNLDREESNLTRKQCEAIHDSQGV